MLSEFIFMGTGTSGCVPNITCLAIETPTCKVCIDCLVPGSRNRRRNTSGMLRYTHSDGRTRNILIGKISIVKECISQTQTNTELK